MISNAPLLFRTLVALAGFVPVAWAQVTVVPSYAENFNTLGTALPAGWGVWTDSALTGNGAAFTWAPGLVANNAAASATTYFRNIPGASQNWSSGLSAGADRALGWRAGTAASRDGSITFTLTNTTGWSFSNLSFQLFTPNSAGSAGTFQLQYQIGSSGTFSPLASVSYLNDTAQNPLMVNSITLTSAQLAPLNNRSDLVTLRWDNLVTSGSGFNTLALDNFSYSAGAIPEPSTYAALLGIATLGVAAWRRRCAHRLRGRGK